MNRRGAKKQNGLFNIDFDTGVNDNMDDDDNDSDLEAELLALTGGGNGQPKRPARKTIPSAGNLDVMVAESMKDLPSDDDISVDENDPDLLSELNDIVGEDDIEEEEAVPTPVTTQPSISTQLLEQRLHMYEEAEKHAKSSGDTTKARRYGRGKNTIKDLIKQANSGKSINPDDIPPEVKIPKAQPSEPSPEIKELPTPEVKEIPTPETIKSPSPPPQEETENAEIVENLVKILKDRNMQYKVAALKAKKSNDVQTAVNYLKIAKQFEHVIQAVESGQPVDLSKMPGPPPEHHEENVESQQVQRSSQPESLDVHQKRDEPPPPAASLSEALEQCIEFYKKQVEKAKSEENSSKVRRIGRIIKQFEQAIKLNRAGKTVDVEELPIPPGFPPLPGRKVPSAPTSPAKSETPSAEIPETKPKPPTPQLTTRNTGNHVPNSRAEQQMQMLLTRQKQFKEAALKAKQKGEMTQAKEFLRTAKGFDKLIEATSCGLPVDFSTLPLPPDAKSHLDKEFDLVSAEDCIADDDSSSTDILTRLEHQLQKQLKMCLTTRDHNKSMGDVAGTNRFERLALNVTKDLDLIRLAKTVPNINIPKFHYEYKDFSVVKSFTDLTDNELELSIMRGINYNTDVPKEIDTYVKFSFPWPQETPYVEKTVTIKDTNNPEYNATFSIPINRTARTCQRTFKRHAVKFEVYSKGGWFKSDTLIGSTSVKLQNLETRCELHESFDLMEGRKKVGGKLEIRMRIRHPILTQEVEQLREKWLIIDS